jgi:hypothetical protein
MFLEQSQELLLESHFAMMVLLVSDVLNGFLQERQLTPKAPYFTCQPNSPCSEKVSCTHLEEPPLISCIALALGTVEGSDSKIWK